MSELDARDLEIQKIINQLDEVAVRYEQKWGIGQLQKLCSPELLEKWMRQCEKFEDAMFKKDVDLIRDLVSGFKRAYIALEGDVLSRGNNPPDIGKSLLYEFPSGKKVVVCENHDDLRCLSAQFKGQNCELWTIKEIAEFIENNAVLVNQIEKTKPTPSKEPDPFDFSIGDKIDMD